MADFFEDSNSRHTVVESDGFDWSTVTYPNQAPPAVEPDPEKERWQQMKAAELAQSYGTQPLAGPPHSKVEEAMLQLAAQQYENGERDGEDIANELARYYGPNVARRFVSEIWGPSERGSEPWTADEYAQHFAAKQAQEATQLAQMVAQVQDAHEEREQAEAEQEEAERSQMVHGQVMEVARRTPGFEKIAQPFLERLAAVEWENGPIERPELATLTAETIVHGLNVEGAAARKARMANSILEEEAALTNGWNVGGAPKVTVPDIAETTAKFLQPTVKTTMQAPPESNIKEPTLLIDDPMLPKFQTAEEGIIAEFKESAEEEERLDENLFGALDRSRAREHEIQQAARERREPDLAKFEEPAPAAAPPPPSPLTEGQKAANRIGEEWSAHAETVESGWNIHT